MVVSIFSVLNKDSRERFFKKNFLLANVKPEIVIKMLFLTMSNIDVDFQTRNLQWKSYITRDVFPTTKRVKLIGKKEFAAATLNLELETFIFHITALSVDPSDKVYPLRRAQIAHLKADKASTEIPSKYTDIADVFLPKLAVKLPKHTEINNHTIELIDDQQFSYDSIYNLGSMELETLKAYIENNLTNAFISLFKSSVGAPILFNKKLDGSLRLCVDY